MITQIETAPGPYGLDIKRCYIPVTVHAVCPQCGAAVTRDLGTNYLSYPRIGAPERVTFTHAVASFEEPDHEWTEYILLTLTVGAAP